MLTIGIALLQSTTPAMMVALAYIMPTLPATAAGLAFGLAIAIGGIPQMFGYLNDLSIVLLILIMTVLVAVLLPCPLNRENNELV